MKTPKNPWRHEDEKPFKYRGEDWSNNKKQRSKMTEEERQEEEMWNKKARAELW